MKSAHQVLSGGKIDAGLAADRGIYLRQKCRRHLHKRQSAQVNRRPEPGQIADHAAAEFQDKLVSFKAVFAEECDRFLQHAKRLVTLAFGHQPYERSESGSLQRTLNIPSVQVKNALVR